MSQSKNIVEIKGVTKVYPGPIHALDKVTLDIAAGDFVSLIGPSGCGKTTLLKIISGIEGYQTGDVFFEGQRIHHTFDWRRSVIYQDIRVFPWMKVKDNLYFALENKGLKKEEARKAGVEMMKFLSMEHIADRYPLELSAGELQMVGVARVLAMNPDLILCDEPFSSLDWPTRQFLQLQILKYWLERKKTVIFVTHDVEEAVYLAQRVVTMTVRPGRIKEIVDVDLPDERWKLRRNDPKVLKYAQKVGAFIGDEIRKARELEVKVGY